MSIALVTGSTSGIGAGFAERLAARGYDLVLVARSLDRLQAQAAELEHRFGASVEVLDADLADRDQLGRVEERLRSSNRPIGLLVNNAGMSTGRSFLGNDSEAEQHQLDVNVTAVLRLTHAAVPGMVDRRSGGVVNMSSISGWVAGGTYSASKAWVTAFSAGLANELAGTGVRVVAVCPGFVHTNFHAAGDMDVSAIPEWLWLDPGQVVDDAFAALRMNRSISVPTTRFRLMAGAARYLPRRVVTAAYLRARPKN